MAMMIAQTAATTAIQVDLGVDPTRDIVQRALNGYAECASALPAVWPPVPDEQRVRYYAWASRQVQDARLQILAAIDLLERAAFFMGTIAEELDAFATAGTVPAIEDVDLAAEPLDPVIRAFSDTLAAQPQRATAPAVAPAPMKKLPRIERLAGGSWEALPSGEYSVASAAAAWHVDKNIARNRLQIMRTKRLASDTQRMEEGRYLPSIWSVK